MPYNASFAVGEENVMPTAAEKTCTTCQADVAGKKRFKDAAGNYFCPTCWKARGSETPAPPPDSADLARCELCKKKFPASKLGYSASGDLVCNACSAVQVEIGR